MKTIYSRKFEIHRGHVALAMIVAAESVKFFDLWGHVIVFLVAGSLLITDFIYRDRRSK